VTRIEVGKRIADLRRDKNLTQSQFGELLGVSKHCIGKIERGEKSLGDIIPIICEKTGVSADFLYFGAEPLGDMGILSDFTPTQIDMGLDVLKRLAEIIYTADGNELLIKEAMRRQSPTVL
jgi:transcriptional regulator with XRE-family HTH domain